MKPILFPEGQTSFTTSGIGRLPDAISCTATEEQNGQYELHMASPIDGQLMSEIRYSRIIVATPADNKSPQPFRIHSGQVNGCPKHPECLLSAMKIVA